MALGQGYLHQISLTKYKGKELTTLQSVTGDVEINHSMQNPTPYYCLRSPLLSNEIEGAIFLTHKVK